MIEISSEKTKLDVDFIHRFLRKSYWARGIPRAVLQKSIDNSFCFGMYRCRKQIGFARVITDYTTFAYLADVFIDPAERQKGLGKQLVKEILNCQELQGLRRWHLITQDAQSFYSGLGFLVVSNPEGHMELRVKPGY